LIIDVQREYADPEHSARRGNPQTVATAHHISTLVPQFREAGLKTYWIYYFGLEENRNKPEKCGGGFYKNTPASNDELVPKNDSSAFEGSDIKARLLSADIKTLLVSGFNAGSCVKRTVLDGLSEGFKVCVLSDGVGNDNYNCNYVETDLKIMEAEGAIIKTSSQALCEIQMLKEHPCYQGPSA